MSTIANMTLSTFGISAFDALLHFMNGTYCFGEKSTIDQLQDIIDLTRSTLIELSPMFTAVAGATCFFTATGIWTMYKKFVKQEKADEACPRIKLLQLIKKAHLPGTTESIIKEIDKQNLDVNEKVSASGLNYFLCGCLSGDPDLIKHMILMGANVQAETTEGDTALYLATYAILHSDQHNTESLQMLIKAGKSCKVNKQNKRGYTPLHRAASKGNIKVIQFLLLQGADPYIANNVGVFPIDSAICAGHLEAAQLLQLKFHNPYVWDVVEPHTPLHIKQGLQSPQRRQQLNSSRRPLLRNVFT